MAAKKGEEKGESSTTAAKKGLTANTNGVTNYELPWYAIVFYDLIIVLIGQGWRSIGRSSWTMSWETQRPSNG